MHLLHAGLDLSRHRVDVCVVDAGGEVIEEFAVRPDRGGLADLVANTSAGQVQARATGERTGAGTGTGFTIRGLKTC